MIPIPNIELDKKQIEELIYKYRINRGGEAVVTEGITRNTVAKIFVQYGMVMPMGYNKERKIIELYKRQLEHSTIPVRTISNNGLLVGYEMTTDPRLDTYKYYELTLAERKHLLLKTKDILQYFQDNGIIYGDIELRNILFNRENGEVIFCDMDNIQLESYPMDIRPKHLEDFCMKRNVDESVHPFMHNQLTLRVFDLDQYSSRSAIREKFTRPATKIIKSMKDPNNFIEDYIIKYAKKK